MLNYNFDNEGYFTGVSKARVDHLASAKYGSTVYLKPRNSTLVSIPNVELGEYDRFRWNGEGWFVETLIPEEPEEEENGGDDE